MSRRVPDDVRKGIAEMTRAGATVDQIRGLLSLGESTVRRIRRAEGTPGTRGLRPRSWSPQDEANAVALLRDGASYREVERSTGIPRTTLIEHHPGYGWTLSQSGSHAVFLQSLPTDLREALVQKVRLN